MELKDYINQFKQIVDQIYGTYLDSMNGFQLNIEATKIAEDNLRKRHIEWIELNPNRNVSDLSNMVIGISPHRGRKHGHGVTSEERISRNAPQGRNSILTTNLYLVMIYQYWEDHFRKLIAQCLGRRINDIRVPIFSDLRLLRRSIIHNLGVALSDIERCEMLKWFKRGKQIQITGDMFNQLIDEVLDYLDNIETNS